MKGSAETDDPREASSGVALDRRSLLRLGGMLGLSAGAARLVAACSAAPSAPSAGTGAPVVTAGWQPLGPLHPADANGLRLPGGFSSRIVATTGTKVAGTTYTWPADPDGAATFARSDGGWIHVVNHETSAGAGGVSRIEFNASGTIVDAGRILGGTSRNCAGGATPWGTWLSCEEVSRGQVYECDPSGASAAVVRPGLGAFNHEAVAVDYDNGRLYLTEDQPDGCLYRFVPTAYPSLANGTLQVLCEESGALLWRAVPDPSAVSGSTRNQVATAKRFAGGEGICFFGGTIYFTTKYDNRVWSFHPPTKKLSIVYDAATATNPVLTGVDNITANGRGDLFVAEDGGDMQIVMLAGSSVTPIVQVMGVSGSEITGPSFNPAGTRLYFSSQRNPGTTYEISGPFRT